MQTNLPSPACPKCGAAVPADAPQGLCPKCVLAGVATATDHAAPAPATSEIPSLERVAAAFPNLEVIELIGRGGMGFVFKARQPHLDRFVALKLLPDRLARDPQFAERFNREGRVLAKLNHPNIVSIFDFGRTEHFYFLLMEFVDGVNLRQAMQAGRFSPAEALAIVPKICEALQYAHEQGVLHRDIKPENILLDARGRVKIADFGIAKLVGEDQPSVTLTGTGAALGTPHYMAPEQLEKPSQVDHRADIYSLGVVFYEMLTGELPLGRFGPPSAKTPVGPNVDEVVFRTLERDREKRYQSAGEVKTRVEHISEAGLDAATAAPATGSGPHGTVVTPATAPGWIKPVGILFLVLGALGVPPTVLALASSKFVLNLSTLLALTGAALLTRNRFCRRAALAANALGLLLPWVSALNVAAALQNGTLPFNWSPNVWAIPNSAGLAVLFALLEISTFAAGLWVLLRSDVKPLFATAPPVVTAPRPPGSSPAPSFSRRAIWAVALAVLGILAIRGVLIWRTRVVLVSKSAGPSFEKLFRASSERLEPATTPASASTQPIRVRFRVAKGQVATFELVRRDTEPPAPVPMFAGFLAAADDERCRGEFILAPATPFGSSTNARTWTMRLEADDGPKAGGTFADFGELLSNLPPSPNNFVEIDPERSFELPLTHPYPLGADTNQLVPHPVLSLVVSSTAASRHVPRHRDSITVSTGSTNWIPTLAGLPDTSRKASDPVNWIRFTFTAVELREDTQGRWLTFDYANDIHGDCEPAFRWEASLAGFTPQTRTTAFVTDAAGDSPSVRHQRAEFLMPDFVDRATLLQFRDDLDRGMVRQSVVVHAGQDAPLFGMPVPNRGSVRGWIGARLRPAGPIARTPTPAEAIAIRLARGALAETRQRFAVGSATPLEVAEAERDLAVAEACGDALLVSGAKLKYAEANLESARKAFEVGRLTQLELQTAEAERDVAKIQYDTAALARTDSSPPSQADEAGGADAVLRLESAQVRLRDLKKEVEVGALAPQGPEIVEAEAEVAVIEAEARGDVVGAARLRLETAGRLLRLVEKLHEVGKASTEDVDRARRDEVRARARLTTVEASRKP